MGKLLDLLSFSVFSSFLSPILLGMHDVSVDRNSIPSGDSGQYSLSPHLISDA